MRAWLVVGQCFGLSIAYLRDIGAMLETALNMDEGAPAAHPHTQSLVLVMLGVICGVPAFGGLVLVGLVLRDTPSCVLI
jgi:hypothetical protein